MIQLAIHGAPPDRGPEPPWPAWPVRGAEEHALMDKVIDSRWVGPGGAKIAERANTEVVVINQPLLLGDESDMADIITAVTKIHDHADELAGVEVGQAIPASVAAPRA